MLNKFNTIVLEVATIILILVLVVIGILMYYFSKKSDFPPVVSECPDYWNVESSNEDGDSKTVCKNVLKINPNSVSQSNNCAMVNPINFVGPSDDDTICNKYKWATKCGVVWDGVTNNNASCVK